MASNNSDGTSELSTYVPTLPPQLSLGSVSDSVSLSQDHGSARLRRRLLVGPGCLAPASLPAEFESGLGLKPLQFGNPEIRIGGTRSSQAVLQLPTAKHTPSTHHVPNTCRWLSPLPQLDCALRNHTSKPGDVCLAAHRIASSISCCRHLIHNAASSTVFGTKSSRRRFLVACIGA